MVLEAVLFGTSQGITVIMVKLICSPCVDDTDATMHSVRDLFRNTDSIRLDCPIYFEQNLNEEK